jgi:hypothetical protein
MSRCCTSALIWSCFVGIVVDMGLSDVEQERVRRRVCLVFLKEADDRKLLGGTSVFLSPLALFLCL